MRGEGLSDKPVLVVPATDSDRMKICGNNSGTQVCTKKPIAEIANAKPFDNSQAAWDAGARVFCNNPDCLAWTHRPGFRVADETSPEEDEGLKCPECHTPLGEDDDVCPGCQRPIGTID
jgi:hypothetical protein